MHDHESHRMKRRSLLAAGSVLAVAPQLAFAQDKYPSRPIDVIVPWGPGGGADQLARLTAKIVEPMMKTSFPVVNVPGATGATGMAKLLADQADGYAMAVYIADTNALLANPGARWKLEDIEPIAIMMQCPSFLFVAENGRFKDWAQLEKEARAKPKTLKIATLGFGSVDDMTLGYLESKGIQVVEVPYAKPSERYVSVIGGHVDALYEQAGELDGLALGLGAVADAPDVELALEAGAHPAVRVGEDGAGQAVQAPRLTRVVRAQHVDGTVLSDAMAKVAATEEYKKFLEEQFAAADSFIPADKAKPFLQAQLSDMKAAMVKKS